VQYTIPPEIFSAYYRVDDSYRLLYRTFYYLTACFLNYKAGVGNHWLASQIWLIWWRHLARLIFS